MNALKRQLRTHSIQYLYVRGSAQISPTVLIRQAALNLSNVLHWPFLSADYTDMPKKSA